MCISSSVLQGERVCVKGGCLGNWAVRGCGTGKVASVSGLLVTLKESASMKEKSGH